MRNLLSRVPRSTQTLVASFVRTISAQPDAALTRRQHAAVVEELRARFPKAAELLEAREDLVAFTGFAPLTPRPWTSTRPARETSAGCPNRGTTLCGGFRSNPV